MKKQLLFPALLAGLCLLLAACSAGSRGQIPPSGGGGPPVPGGGRDPLIP